MDITTFIGIALAVGCILVGQALEGGQLGSMLQVTAFLIVIGGTLGAVITQFPVPELKRAMREVREVVTSRRPRLEPLITRLVELARRSRRDGLLAMEDEVIGIPDPFFRQAITSLIDGYDALALRSMLEARIDYEEECRTPGPRFFEAAGGYAPTIGILGAVIGLIQVMEHLDDPSQLGPGIAVAFVSTIYGVASANLVFLPFAEKLKMKIRADLRRKELIVEGICSIQEGVHPRTLRERLEVYTTFDAKRPAAEQKPVRAGVAWSASDESKKTL
ncbi:MAG: flagellar motor protein [Myxococcota bacterium]